VFVSASCPDSPSRLSIDQFELKDGSRLRAPKQVLEFLPESFSRTIASLDALISFPKHESTKWLSRKCRPLSKKTQVKQSLSLLFFAQLMNGTGHRRQFIAQAARPWFPGGLCVSENGPCRAEGLLISLFGRFPTPQTPRPTRGLLVGSRKALAQSVFHLKSTNRPRRIN
jgi:hypothetical protein